MKHFMRHRLLALCAALLLACLLPLTAFAAPVLISEGADSGGIIVVGDDADSPEPPSDPPETSMPEPVIEAKYSITIAPPSGWYTKSASVTIKLEDVNGTGFDKAEAKLAQNGSWQDISDALRANGSARLDISDNGTVYITITDRQGKAHVKSLYIECFDRESPTVKARIDGKSLRAEADDALSGVAAIFVNGYEFDDLRDGALDIRVREYVETDEKEIFVYAVDEAGNRGKTVTVKNPYYADASEASKPECSKPESSAAEKPAQDCSASSGSSAASSAPVVSAPAASTPAPAVPAAQAPTQQAAEPEAAVSDAEDPGSVTPTAGTGSVIENSVKTPEQREFFTITTDAGNDFYIVVDKQKNDKNVYLLSAVTEDDLTGLARPSEHAIPADELRPDPEPLPVTVEPEPVPAPEPEQPVEPEETGSTSVMLTVLLLAVAGGGAAYYFKILKPRREREAMEDWENEDYEEEPDQPDHADETEDTDDTEGWDIPEEEFPDDPDEPPDDGIVYYDLDEQDMEENDEDIHK